MVDSGRSTHLIGKETKCLSPRAQLAHSLQCHCSWAVELIDLELVDPHPRLPAWSLPGGIGILIANILLSVLLLVCTIPCYSHAFERRGSGVEVYAEATPALGTESQRPFPILLGVGVGVDADEVRDPGFWLLSPQVLVPWLELEQRVRRTNFEGSFTVDVPGRGYVGAQGDSF